MPCPDCKDGFYYPLSGPREVCQTCNNIETATKNLHKAIADQVFLRGTVAAAAYTQGKNEVLAESYGGPPARDYTIKDLREKGLDTEEAIKVFNKLQRLKQRPHNRGGIVPKGVNVETNERFNVTIGRMVSSQPSSGEISKSTDWAQWFPKTTAQSRVISLNRIFERHPIRLDTGGTPAPIVRSVMESFFRQMHPSQVEHIIEKEDAYVTLTHLSYHLNNAESRRADRRLKYKTHRQREQREKKLKENGFSPTL